MEESQKATLATFMLEGEARLWWDEVELYHLAGRSLTQVSIEEFSRMFFAKYLPATQRIAMENEFQRLTQGEGSVDTYLYEFKRVAQPKGEKKTGASYAEKGKAVVESSTSQAQPRVFNLCQEEAIKQSDVVTDKDQEQFTKQLFYYLRAFAGGIPVNILLHPCRKTCYLLVPGDELRLSYSSDAAHPTWQSVGHVV
ncbi:hypothetical protein KSP39_PZI010804 [Platanthera zijinensis]|uniref:Retrotransposon gag domain-containing protein n=1 Tax=Platanthera zijinensis TaxID=2320716 RepID=A0AAP0G6N3_9ASPA